MAFVVDRYGGVLYVDGVNKGEAGWNSPIRFDNGLGGPTSTTAPLQFGRFDQYQNTFGGTLGEVILRNASLSAEEISRHMTRRVTPADDRRIIGIWHHSDSTWRIP